MEIILCLLKILKILKYSFETNTHSKRNNIKIMIGNETDEITEELFDSLLQRYQESMKGSEFVFDCVDLLFYKCH